MYISLRSQKTRKKTKLTPEVLQLIQKYLDENKNKFQNKSTDYIGVSVVQKERFSKRKNKVIKYHYYRAYIHLNNKFISLGMYTNLQDAIVARLKAEQELYGDFAPQKDLFEKYKIYVDK